MTAGAQKFLSRQFYAGKTDSRPPRQDALPASPRAPKLMDQLHEALRSRHYIRRIEQAYCQQVKRSIDFHNICHLAEKAESENNQGFCIAKQTQKVLISTNPEDAIAKRSLQVHILNNATPYNVKRWETMIRFDEQYLVDEEGNRKAVVVPISSWQQILEALDELDDIRAYDEAKREHSDPIPFGQAISEIKERMSDWDMNY
jgi:hypothetical protein